MKQALIIYFTLILLVMFTACHTDSQSYDMGYKVGYIGGKYANFNRDSVYNSGWKDGFNYLKYCVDKSNYQLDSSVNLIFYKSFQVGDTPHKNDTTWEYKIVPKKIPPQPFGDPGTIYIKGEYNNPDSIKVLEKRFHFTIIKH